MKDDKLLRRAQKGDEAAFEELVRLHEKAVYAVCWRICRKEEDAMDAAQETFLAAWRGLGGFRGEAAFSTWLTRLATNASLDLLRKKKHQREEISVEGVQEEGLQLPDKVESGPQEEVERQERAQCVRDALLELTDEHREILVLREMRELSYEEIAAQLGISIGTVRSRISRAREKLREILLRQGNFFAAETSKKTGKEGCK